MWDYEQLFIFLSIFTLLFDFLRLSFDLFGVVDFISVSSRLDSLLAVVYADLLFVDRIWIWGILIVNWLITTFAEAVWMMCSVRMLARRCLPLITFRVITEMTHEFSPMLSVIMTANVQVLQVFQNILEFTLWFII